METSDAVADAERQGDVYCVQPDSQKVLHRQGFEPWDRQEENVSGRRSRFQNCWRPLKNGSD